MNLRETLVRFWEDDSGPEMVEWAVVTLLLLVATVGAMVLLRGALIELFQNAFDKLQDPPPDSFP